MNWLDFVLLIILLASLIGGYRRGLTQQVIGLVAGIAALVLGVWFYGTAGAYLLPYISSRPMANACGFAIVFCGVLFFGAMVSFVSGKVLKVTGLSVVDHLLGLGFGLLRGLLFAVVILMGAMAFAHGDRPPDAIVNSRMAPYVVDASRLCANIAPHELREGFRKTYAQVKTAWGAALEKGLRTLPNGEKRKDEGKI